MRVYLYIYADDRIGRVRGASTADVLGTSPKNARSIGTQEDHDRPEGRMIDARTGTIVEKEIGITEEKERGKTGIGRITGGSDTMTDMTTATAGHIGMSEDSTITGITSAGAHHPDSLLGNTSGEGIIRRKRSAGMVEGVTMSVGMGGGRDVVRVLIRVLRGDDLDDEI